MHFDRVTEALDELRALIPPAEEGSKTPVKYLAAITAARAAAAQIRRNGHGAAKVTAFCVRTMEMCCGAQFRASVQ